MPKAYAGVRTTDRSMPSNKQSALVTAVRVVLAVAGTGVAATTFVWLATMPPPDGDGFAHGMAALVGGLILVASLGVAAASVALPSVVGLRDPLGFDRHQRLALKGAGVLLGGGFVGSVAATVLGHLLDGLIFLFLSVVLAAVVVGATLVWRLAAAVVGRLRPPQTGGEGAP